MKLDPAEIRRRNFITQFPYQTPVALLYDTGDYEATLGEAIKMADVAGFAARKAPGPPGAAGCAGWATPATSRPAGSRLPTSRGRWAPAPGCSRRGRYAC